MSRRSIAISALLSLLALVPLAPAAARHWTPVEAAQPVAGRGPALAQAITGDRAPSGITAGRLPPEAAAPQGPFGRAWGWVKAKQQELNQKLAAAVRELKAAGSATAAAVLAFISFSYGVLHAAGPGHGKAVISSYVLANERTVRRGIKLSFLAAFIQALSAIVLVGVLAIALKATSLTLRATESWIETVSWAFVATVGAWLLWGQVSALTSRRAGAHAGTHDDAHGHHHHHAHAGCGHHPHHVHGPGESHEACCGHAHMPDPEALGDEDWSWRKGLAIAVSVGIRPCTGAILVLVFALSQGLFWAGVFATFAMAIGTAITVSVLASLAVGSRELATRMAGGDGRWATAVATGAGLAGSALVFLLGTTFFVASLAGPAPL